MMLITDFFQMLLECAGLLVKGGGKHLAAVFLTGALLAASCYLFSLNLGKFWYKKYKTTLGQHIMAAMAAGAVFGLAVFFGATAFMQPMVDIAVDITNKTMLADTDFSSRLFKKAYKAVEDLGIEDFSLSNGNVIPVTSDSSRVLVASIYAQSVADNFIASRPFLGKYLIVQQKGAAEHIQKTVNEHFSKNKGSYPAVEMVGIAGNIIKKEMSDQVPLIVFWIKLSIFFILLILQGIPWAWISLAARKENKSVS